ncbi:MAG: thioesterase family protein [Acidimicrobiales bacterium]|nr:thioesterase family protein [Acidimicrobiales bacterium]
MTDVAAFRPTGPNRYQPAEAATGSWDPKLLHGAALSALLAGRLQPETGTVARFAIDFLAPVPMTELTLDLIDDGGGSRVQRRRMVVSAGGRVVATASALIVREGDLDLPEKALNHPSPFPPDQVPSLTEPHPTAAGVVGWESFVTLGVAIELHKVPDDRRTHQWIGLTVPVVEGLEPLGIELVAAAADFAQSAVHRQLRFDDWSYRNADLTIHLARPVTGTWIGLRSEALVQPVGAGFNAADLFDAGGRVGRSASTLVVEPRSR